MLIGVKFPAQKVLVQYGVLLIITIMPKTSVGDSSSYRKRELVKCDDFELWLIQIGIFVLYVKLVLKTRYAQPQMVTKLLRKTFRSFTKKESLVSI